MITVQEISKRDKNLGQPVLTKAKTSDYEVNYETDYGLVVAAVSSDIDITLPLKSTIPTGEYKKLEIIPIVQNGYKVRIKTQGSDTFPFGNTWFDLPASQKQFEIGIGEHGFNLRRNISVIGEYHRTSSWSASNFSSNTSIPLQVEDKNTQTQLLVWGEDGAGGTNPSRVYVQVAGSYKVSFGVDIDSTGGGTWNATAGIYVNGILVPYATIRTGNYGGEDQSMSFIPKTIDLEVGDYVEVKIDQNNLTGSIVGFTFNIEIRL